MAENQTVTHITQNGRFQLEIERAAVKGVDGFKVRANSDSWQQVVNEAQALYEAAEAMTFKAPEPKTETKEK